METITMYYEYTTRSAKQNKKNGISVQKSYFLVVISVSLYYYFPYRWEVYRKIGREACYKLKEILEVIIKIKLYK